MLAHSTGQGAYSWDVGQALSTPPINLLLPLLIPMVYFQVLVMSLSLPGRLKGKKQIYRKPGLLFKLQRTIYLLVFAEIWNSPGSPRSSPAQEVFTPTEFPEQTDTFPVSRYSAKPMSTKIYPHHCKSMCKCSKEKDDFKADSLGR